MLSVLLFIAIKKDELTNALQMDEFRQGHWNLQETCALSGEGLTEGLIWLVNTIRSPPDNPNS